jgi:hypothetical protein
MTLPRLRQSGFRQVLALLAFASACVGYSATAQAGCAHPGGPARNGMSDYRLASLQIFEIGGPSSKMETSPAETPWAPQPDRPCSGPNCKQNSAPSQVPSHVSFSPRIDGCLPASRLDPAAPGASALRLVEPVLSSIHTANTLERPPRTSAS